ncbi:BglG family transcription antiterminator [Paenibacillus polymyxa]|uniref:BglG family transcription antiterminator n=1 Tax=Paenibacillus polymyxa TaxID=1406 RepID=UPI0025B62CDA|nr:PRD domain-containing protein [Paenibacillus polymyxa]MDN4084531.1 PRD domain-containing protein [Paenibacillus polymyxa]MDN4090162.1 PRD domain-containing protein [Paenibacillus polymyxa]MDN4110835.1 PRD domain-containing protein [Paenibacillus polymyxa]
MQDIQKQLISFLMSQDTPSMASEIADHLKVSVRSVKTYIKNINLLSNEKVILSSNKGYLLDKKNAGKLLDDQNSIPQYYSERAIYIIKKILVDHIEPDIYDLCNQLYIGFSTLKNDLSKMNVTFKKFNIKFVTKHDRVLIIGSEKDKRSLLSNVIFEETPSSILGVKTLNKSFGKEFINKISKIIQENFLIGSYYIDDFAFVNLVLHFSILIDRVKKGNLLDSPSIESEFLSDDTEDIRVIEQISSSIEEAFDIQLPENERYEIYILFKTKVNYRINKDYKKLESIVGEEVMQTTGRIISEVRDLYSIDLNSDEFILPFVMHIKSLITRASLNKSNKNPLLTSIKEDGPFIYDMAIFISLRLSESYNIQINEDEIAFIAIHIGSEVDRQKANTDKLKCILLCPTYLGLEKKIYNYLSLTFPENINIERVVTSYDQLSNHSFDLLFTIVDNPKNTLYSYIRISPLNLDVQKGNIFNKIHEIQDSKKKRLILDNFENYFNQNLFYIEDEMTTEEIIHKICGDMESLGFVSSYFKKTVFEREMVSSTSFGNVAIPHSVHMNALQTSIGVLISRKGIQWGSNTVNFVLLIAINKLDKQRFLVIYNAILSLFDNKNFIEMSRKANTFDEFKRIVFSFL